MAPLAAPSDDQPPEDPSSVEQAPVEQPHDEQGDQQPTEAVDKPLLTLRDGLPPVPEGVTMMPSRRGQRGPGH